MLARREWHEEEDRRANKRSLRIAIIAAVTICVIRYLWLTTLGGRPPPSRRFNPLPFRAGVGDFRLDV
jgi:hypothetical protein